MQENNNISEVNMRELRDFINEKFEALGNKIDTLDDKIEDNINENPSLRLNSMCNKLEKMRRSIDRLSIMTIIYTILFAAIKIYMKYK